MQGLLNALQGNHDLASMHWQIHSSAILIAQFKDALSSNFSGAWDNFIQSGQVWALLIGMAVGYLFRSFTAY